MPKVSPLTVSIVAIVAALFIFVVIPKIMDSTLIASPTRESGNKVVVSPTGKALTPEEVEAEAKRVALEQERILSAQMLNTHFSDTTARDEIPEDYPRKKVGACPYSKPLSSPLPLRNMPRCKAVTSDNMYLGCSTH